jgi:hypothetical protein
MSASAAAPGEHVLRLSIASTLFPHLPHRSRAPFRAAMALAFLAVVVFGLLRWQAPLIALSALALPLLFAMYLRAADVDDDLPAMALILTVLLGVGFGVGWGVLSGGLIAERYDVAFGDVEVDAATVLTGLGVALLTAVLSLLPAVVVRLTRPPARESLNGFAIGALGAIAFTAAGTLTRFAPQFATGPKADAARPITELLVQAAILGVALPLTAAALGGLFGGALWFTPPAGSSRRPAVVLLAASAAAALLLYSLLGVMESLPFFEGLHLGLHLVIAAIALLALRIGLQAMLLYEERDPQAPDRHVLCPHCDHVVPDTAFCPNCGVAARASSRTARQQRRAPPSAPVTRPGYAMPAGSYETAPTRHITHARVLTGLGVGTAVVAAVAVAVSVLATPESPKFVCPPDCGQPPIGEPVETNPWFMSSDGRFSVQYPRAGTAYEVTFDPDGVNVDFTAGDTGRMQFFGLPANGRTSKQIAEQLIGEKYPDATTDYEIPNAMVGYQPGYGVVKDAYPQDSAGTFTRLRLLVMVAIKKNYALVAAAIGPYHEFSPSVGSGHPSGVNMQLALDMGKYVNSFIWRDNSHR